MKGESPFSPHFPPVLFWYWCFLNFADSTNIGTWNTLLLLQLLQLIVPTWGGRGTWVGDVGGRGERRHGGGDELKEQKYMSSQTLNVTSRHFYSVFFGNFFNFSYNG